MPKFPPPITDWKPYNVKITYLQQEGGNKEYETSVKFLNAQTLILTLGPSSMSQLPPPIATTSMILYPSTLDLVQPMHQIRKNPTLRQLTLPGPCTFPTTHLTCTFCDSHLTEDTVNLILTSNLVAASMFWPICVD